MEECDCLINQSETGYYSHITCDVEATGTLQLISQHRSKSSTVLREGESPCLCNSTQHCTNHRPQQTALWVVYILLAFKKITDEDNATLN